MICAPLGLLLSIIGLLFDRRKTPAILAITIFLGLFALFTLVELCE